jgi:hypothetical protein
LNWFWPIFNGHAFVLARANEYEADACSVRLAGADAAARALIRTRVDGALLGEKFWPGIFSQANQVAEPPANALLALNETVKAGPATDDAARWLREAFLTETNNADTHPCLKDRLRAIGRLPAEIEDGKFPEVPPPIPAQSAATFFLGDFADIAARQLSEEWRKSMAPQWKARHEKAKKLADELAALEKPADAPPTAAQIWQKALKVVELHGDTAAVATLQQIVTLEPKHAGANFILGRHFLETDDPRGVEFIETAIASDPALAQNGCNLLYAHFNRTGQRDKLRPLENRFDELQKQNALAQAERARITVADTFITHELTAQQIADLRKIFSTEPRINSAAVARKQLKYLSTNPCYAIGLKVKVSWWKLRSSGANQQLVRQVLNQIHLPGHYLVFVSEQNLKSLGKKVFAAPGAVIYEREKD